MECDLDGLLKSIGYIACIQEDFEVLKEMGELPISELACLDVLPAILYHLNQKLDEMSYEVDNSEVDSLVKVLDLVNAKFCGSLKIKKELRTMQYRACLLHMHLIIKSSYLQENHLVLAIRSALEDYFPLDIHIDSNRRKYKKIHAFFGALLKSKVSMREYFDKRYKHNLSHLIMMLQAGKETIKSALKDIAGKYSIDDYRSDVVVHDAWLEFKKYSGFKNDDFGNNALVQFFRYVQFRRAAISFEGCSQFSVDAITID